MRGKREKHCEDIVEDGTDKEYKEDDEVEISLFYAGAEWKLGIQCKYRRN